MAASGKSVMQCQECCTLSFTQLGVYSLLNIVVFASIWYVGEIQFLFWAGNSVSETAAAAARNAIFCQILGRLHFLTIFCAVAGLWAKPGQFPHHTPPHWVQIFCWCEKCNFIPGIPDAVVDGLILWRHFPCRFSSTYFPRALIRMWKSWTWMKHPFNNVEKKTRTA